MIKNRIMKTHNFGVANIDKNNWKANIFDLAL